jgi:hypothetical protein
MLECAITSIKCALRDEFPEFEEFYNQGGWEKKDDTDLLAECDTCEFSEIAEGIEDDGADGDTSDDAHGEEKTAPTDPGIEEN